MSELVSWLLAQLDADEAVARAAGVGEWEAGERCVWRSSPIVETEIVTDGADGLGGTESPEIAAHIARHDPARVLVEVEAKRAIVALMSDEVEYVVYSDDVLRLLALPFADRPGFDETWRP